MTTHADRYLRVADVASLLHIAPNTVRKWEAKGILPKAVRLGPRRDRRFPMSEITRFQELGGR